MNIIIQGHNRAVECRPDTTWERENRDLYSPDFVVAYHYAPVLFARICKAGKCVGTKFATRYYDAFGYGLLLYPELSDGTLLTVMDRTSFLPSPLYGRAVLAKGDNPFELRLDGTVVYSTCCGTESMIEDAIVRASQYISVRIGDIVAVQLAPISPLLRPSSQDVSDKAPGRTDGLGGHRISATFCGNWLLDFSIR